MPRVCITVHGKNAQPYRFSLERKVVRLGRAADNDIVIDCPSVSSHHCEMRRVEGGYILKDTGSTNGIKLDGDRLEIIDLDNNQEILIGDAGMDFELSNDELDELAKEERKPQQRAHLPTEKAGDDGEKAKDDGPEARREGARRETAKLTRRPVPAPAAARHAGSPPPLASAQSTNSGANFAITIGLLFLALMAFYLGLASSHRNEYPKRDYPESKGLWGDMFSNEDTLRKKSAEGEAE